MHQNFVTVGATVGASDIVPISQGQLKAFMYENFSKGKQSEQERIVFLIENYLENVRDQTTAQNLIYLLKRIKETE
jgi:hypothetical protein